MKRTSGLLMLVLMLVPVMQLAAQTPRSTERARKGVARLGLGSKAKATITLNDGTKVKGYIYSTGFDDFVIRDRKTDAPTTVRYADVKDVSDNSNKDLLIGIGAAAAGAGIFAWLVTGGRGIPGRN